MLPFAIIWLMFDSIFIIGFITSGSFIEMLWYIIPFFALHLMPVWIWLSNVLTAKKIGKILNIMLLIKELLLNQELLA